VTGVLLPVVGAKFGCFRNGDSGRGKDGLTFGLNSGLGARAPGPIDCEKFGRAGVSGLKLGFSMVERLKLEYGGVVGVGGSESDVIVDEERFVARCMGRKMPDPGTEVVKYRMLQNNQPGTCIIVRHMHIPINIAIVLPTHCVFSAQFDAAKDTLFAPDASDKLDNTMHATRHVDSVAHLNLLAVAAHSVRRGGRSTY
jgi:hypothetical protein